MGNFNLPTWSPDFSHASAQINDLQNLPIRGMQQQRMRLDLDRMLEDLAFDRELKKAIASAKPGEEDRAYLQVLRSHKPREYNQAMNNVWDTYAKMADKDPEGASQFLFRNTGVQITPKSKGSDLEEVKIDGKVRGWFHRPSQKFIDATEKPEKLEDPKNAALRTLLDKNTTKEDSDRTLGVLNSFTEATTRDAAPAKPEKDKEISTYTRSDGKQVTIFAKAGMSPGEPGATYEVESAGTVRQPPRDPGINDGRQANIDNLKFNQTNKLLDDFTKQSEGARGRLQGYRMVREGAKDATGASDILMTYGFIRLVDPNRVTEGELQLAKEAGATIPTQWKNWIEQKFGSGAFFGKDGTLQRKQMLEAAKKIAKPYARDYKQLEGRFRKSADDWQLNPEQVIGSPFKSLGVDEVDAGEPGGSRTYSGTIRASDGQEIKFVGRSAAWVEAAKAQAKAKGDTLQFQVER